ncbi:MAG: hypothetical protein DIU78_004785 [Pseudomonadota bacterium]
MRRVLSSWAVAAFLAASMTVLACGDEDEPPTETSGGSAGKGGAGGKGGSGGTFGSSGGIAATGGNGGATEQGGAGGEAEPTGDAGAGPGGAGGTPDDAGPGGAAGTGGGAAGAPDAAECDLSGEGLEREALPADIEEDLTLTNDRVWVIEGTVHVHDGATLTIPPCTRLEGLSDPTPGFVVALRGGRIVADGTAEEPILFTSSQPVGERRAGDWGGVVLLGRAPITRPGGDTEAIYEGLTDEIYTYGGDDPDNDSGTLRYVRIEFGGWDIFPDKEVNGLSMAGVGRRTVIDHVMVSNTLDDCFEWWGGTVEASHLIANNCGDDYFDGDEGWRGGARYLFGRRDVASVDSDDPNGFELDGINDGTEPRTAFSFQNVTLCGTGEPSPRANPHYGMLLRELVTGTLENVALLGFEYGIETRDAIAQGDVTIESSSFWALSEGIGETDAGGDDDGGFDDASIFTETPSNEVPDPVPFTVAECLEDEGPTAAVLESGLGAFPDADAVARWALDAPWVDWSED